MNTKLEAEEESKPQLHGFLEETDQALGGIVSSRLPWFNGMELLDEAKQEKRFLSTGFEGIDAILGGGFREGQLTEIAGPCSSGKTQVCLHSAANIVDKQYGSILYLDTCNSFSPKRIFRFINQFSPSPFKEEKERRIQRIMSNIHCQTFFDIFSLVDFLHQLEPTLKHKKVNFRDSSKLCLIIIDSISSLIAPILGGKNSQGRSIMAQVGIMLKKLAHEHNLAILVTNHMVGGEMGSLKPALGETWKLIPHVRLLLGTRTGTNYHTAKIMKHTLMVSGRTGTDFLIPT